MRSLPKNSHICFANIFESCTTCNLNSVGCPGHVGHIDLPVPVYHPTFMDQLLRLLRAKMGSEVTVGGFDPVTSTRAENGFGVCYLDALAPAGRCAGRLARRQVRRRIRRGAHVCRGRGLRANRGKAAYTRRLRTAAPLLPSPYNKCRRQLSHYLIEMPLWSGSEHP